MLHKFHLFIIPLIIVVNFLLIIEIYYHRIIFQDSSELNINFI